MIVKPLARPETRTFGGVKFAFDKEYPFKRDAQKRAEWFRQGGMRARVVHYSQFVHTYAVYFARKPARSAPKRRHLNKREQKQLEGQGLAALFG